MPAERAKLAVVAVGGNSLVRDENHRSFADQYDSVCETVRHVVDLIELGWRILLTHGSGPQVGFILRRSELAMGEVPPVPMDYAGAEVQGDVGYMLQRAFRNEFGRRRMRRAAVAVLTQVLVAADDPAFTHPTKPIGSHMSEAEAKRLAEALEWTVREDAGRGWRRVVPSPRPLEIVDLEPIAALLDRGFVVIACGGGGIPVVRRADGSIDGVEAVIDKDLASSLLARSVKADVLVISTAVEKVALRFNTPRQRWLARVSLAEARRYQQEGHFLEGSMGPKVQAMIEFLEAGGEAGVVTDPPNLSRALRGETGTRFVA